MAGTSMTEWRSGGVAGVVLICLFSDSPPLSRLYSDYLLVCFSQPLESKGYLEDLLFNRIVGQLDLRSGCTPVNAKRISIDAGRLYASLGIGKGEFQLSVDQVKSAVYCTVLRVLVHIDISQRVPFSALPE